MCAVFLSLFIYFSLCLACRVISNKSFACGLHDKRKSDGKREREGKVGLFYGEILGIKYTFVLFILFFSVH